MGQLTTPLTYANFKAYFTRDWPYGTGTDTVTEADVNKGLAMASSVFVPSLYDTTTLYTLGTLVINEQVLAYLYAAAHFVKLDIDAAGGLGAPQPGAGMTQLGEGVLASAGAGGVSGSYTWPDRVAGDPILFQFARTKYGEQFLQLTVPKLVGNIVSVAGANQNFQNQDNDDV